MVFLWNYKTLKKSFSIVAYHSKKLVNIHIKVQQKCWHFNDYELQIIVSFIKFIASFIKIIASFIKIISSFIKITI